jgi:hypothetical protein
MPGLPAAGGPAMGAFLPAPIAAARKPRHLGPVTWAPEPRPKKRREPQVPPPRRIPGADGGVLRPDPLLAGPRAVLGEPVEGPAAGEGSPPGADPSLGARRIAPQTHTDSLV